MLVSVKVTVHSSQVGTSEGGRTQFTQNKNVFTVIILQNARFGVWLTSPIDSTGTNRCVYQLSKLAP